MEELVTHLISYGMDPDKAKLAAADLLLQRRPAPVEEATYRPQAASTGMRREVPPPTPPVATYGPAMAYGYAPQRGIKERGFHDPGAADSKGIMDPQLGFISTDPVLNTALAGYASLLGKQMRERMPKLSDVDQYMMKKFGRTE